MVRLFVAVTDQAWFDQLSASAPHEEVNFWQPNGRVCFQALQPGELFLFKLHAPNNVIAGGGVFSHASLTPLSLAWPAMEFNNGAPSRSEMRRRIARYRRDPTVLDERIDPTIGCRTLTQPFFWPREAWLPVPDSWSNNIVSGKTFSTDDADGRYLWQAVMDRAAAVGTAAAGTGPRHGKPTLITPRLGQGSFRLSVTDHYDRRCAVSGEKTLPILDAAHIRAYEAGGEHALSNGLLLRTDIHRLFDLGYVTVSPDGRFEVSHRLKADFDNGKHYYDLHGTRLRSPRSPAAAPDPGALSWHREHRFLG